MTSFLSPRATNILIYGSALAIACFELAVFGMVLRPNVSERYQAYYITKTSTCWPRPAHEAIYELDRRITLAGNSMGSGARSYLGCGWSEPEDWGTWSIGKEAALQLALSTSSSDLILRTQVQSFAGKRSEQKVEVFVDGALTTTWVIPTGAVQEVEARIPKEATDDGYVLITFKIAFPSSPAANKLSQDNRKLGIGMKWFSISRAD